MTAAEGSPRATPSANVGPESAAADDEGYRSSTISVIRFSVSGSIPFAVETNRRARWSGPGEASRTSLIAAQGTESSSVSECSKASPRSEVARTCSGLEKRGCSRRGDDGPRSVEEQAGDRRQKGHRDDGPERDVAGGGDDHDEDRETDEDRERREREKCTHGRGDPLSAAEAVEQRKDVA